MSSDPEESDDEYLAGVAATQNPSALEEAERKKGEAEAKEAEKRAAEEALRKKREAEAKEAEKRAKEEAERRISERKKAYFKTLL